MPTGSPTGTGTVPASHPPGCYYANPFTNSVQRQCNPIAVPFLAAAGYIGNDGLPANPLNAFPSFAEAVAVAQQTHGGVSGGLGSVTAPTPTTGANPLTGINAIGDFFQRLEQPATWIRVGEFLAGAILLIIGVNALTGNRVSETAKTVASKVPK